MAASTHASAGTRKAIATGRGEGAHVDDTLEVALEHARWRHFAWAVAGCALGVLLLVRLEGGVKLVGALVLLGGLSAARAFATTFLHEAGGISVGDDEVVLSPRLCSGQALTLPLADVRHAYLLKRSLSWATPGPLLVVETSRGAFQYPRDWFAHDGDQRRVMNAINRRLGRI